MAHSLSAKKRIRQNAKCRARNRWRKDQVKDVVKDIENSIATGSKADAAAKLSKAYKTLDKVAAKGTIHKKTASRKKARLAKAINKLSA